MAPILTGRHNHNHWMRGGVSKTEIEGWHNKGREGSTYGEMVRVDFSPSDIGSVLLLPRIPSSHPVEHHQLESKQAQICLQNTNL
jgi:hypothetical protein